VGRVGGREKDGAGVSRWWSRGCCSSCGSWWRELADPFACESSGRVWVPLCTCFDLDRYDHGVEGLDWLLLALVGSGASTCASSGLGSLLRDQAYDLAMRGVFLLVMIAFSIQALMST
jgi:hypothetical protein